MANYGGCVIAVIYGFFEEAIFEWSINGEGVFVGSRISRVVLGVVGEEVWWKG